LGDLGGDKIYCDSLFHALIKQRQNWFIDLGKIFELTVGLL
jgi:hypothetical protein